MSIMDGAISCPTEKLDIIKFNALSDTVAVYAFRAEVVLVELERYGYVGLKFDEIQDSSVVFYREWIVSSGNVSHLLQYERMLKMALLRNKRSIVIDTFSEEDVRNLYYLLREKLYVKYFDNVIISVADENYLKCTKDLFEGEVL